MFSQGKPSKHHFKQCLIVVSLLTLPIVFQSPPKLLYLRAIVIPICEYSREANMEVKHNFA